MFVIPPIGTSSSGVYRQYLGGVPLLRRLVPKVRDFARSLVARHNALEERAGFVELRFPWAG